VVTEFAQPYSITVICELLGVPTDRSAQLLDWSHAIVKMYELTTPDAQKKQATDAAREFMAYARELLRAKRAEPDSRLLSRLAAVEEEGKQLTDDEIICTLIVLLNAGHEATVNTVGNGMRALMLHRDEWNRLVTGRVSSTAAVEEMIRWDPPLQMFERFVLDQGLEIAGQPVAVGDEVAVLFGAANHDPRKFADPDRFDIGRGDATHVGFGGGIHFCVGAPLARLEIAEALAALVRWRPQAELSSEPRFHRTFVIHGLTGLQVRAEHRG
jgi:cytochrome P450